MERNHFYKSCAVIALLFLAGCNSLPKTATPPDAQLIIEHSKPTVDPAMLAVCDTNVPPVSNEADFGELAESFAGSMTRLRACACKQIEMRNLLCKLTKPGCAPVKSCKIKDDGK